MAMSAAHEITSAVSDEAKELGQAATRKVKKLGERRRQHHAEKHPATGAAQRAADELGIDIGAIEGSGKNGRVTVQDVKRAVNGQ
jgi:pyruvate/2-oxoglutarate dehydrogenase complex dihydrolipoamide acyltransferase (E2) component